MAQAVRPPTISVPRPEAPKPLTQRMLDTVERVGNKVPHPAVIFVILIGIVIILSQLFYFMGLHVEYQVINPETHKVENASTAARGLLTVDGIRFMFTGVVQNFMNFNAVGVIIVAMVGVGVAERAGLVNALIRKIVIVAPPAALYAHRQPLVVPRQPPEHGGARASGTAPHDRNTGGIDRVHDAHILAS